MRLIGRRPESLDRARTRIRESLARFVAHGLVPAAGVEGIVGPIRSSTSLDDAAWADLVIEAVPEHQALKHAVFEHLDRVCPPPAVLASSSAQLACRLDRPLGHDAHRNADADGW